MAIDPEKPHRLRSVRLLLTRLLKRRSRQPRDVLRTTTAILKAQQEATLDGILVVDLERRVMSYNRRFLEIWGIPPSVGASADDQGLIHYAIALVADPDEFVRSVNDLYEHPTAVRSDQPIALKDGRIISRTSVPVTTSDGVLAGRAWYFRDITESRRSERLQSALFRISQLSRE